MSRRYIRVQRERQKMSVAYLNRHGKRFEVIIKPDLAFSFKIGQTKSFAQAIVTETIYLDASKGLKASEEQLLEFFGTADPMEIISLILIKGKIQLTTEQRKQFIEEKRKQVISIISRQSVDPRTNLPHPSLRIEQALEQIKFSIDPFKDAEEQAKDLIKLVRKVLPLKIDQISVSIRIPSEYVGKVYGTVKGFGTIKQEEWQKNGSWFAILELPVGLYGSFLEKIGEKTRGNLEAKLIE